MPTGTLDRSVPSFTVPSFSTAGALAAVPLDGAAALLDGVVRRTRLFRSDPLSRGVGAEVWLKCENEQLTRSFKVRGAAVAVARLDPARRARGVVTASAGNHGQGVAAAARRSGVPARVYVPTGVNATKRAAVVALGGEVVEVAGGVAGALAAATRYATARGVPYVHPFDDPDVVAGQATVGLEILRDLPDVGTVVVPVGGGGLLAGVAAAVRATRPGVRVVGVQPDGAAAFARSWEAGTPVPVEPETVADGLAVRRPGDLTLGVALALVDDVWTVPDEVVLAVRADLAAAGVAAEPAGATAVAGLVHAGRRVPGPVVCVVSGANS